MSAENKALVRRLTKEIWSKGNLNLADQIVSTNYVYHDPALAHEPGLEGFKQHVTRVRAAFPDIQFTIDDIIAEGDRVVSRWTARGTHRGDFLGVSGTGKPVTVTGTSTSRISRGKIVEHWSNWDALGLMQQLGVVATLGQAKAQAAGA